MRRLTALAQLVKLLGECKGITKTADLAEATGYTDRAIRKAKAELECLGTPVPNPEPEFRNGTPVPEPEFRTRNQSSYSPHARAYKESPSEIVNTKLLASSAHAREPEIDGLNGSTSRYIDWLASWLNEFAPDRETARIILQSNVELYGPDKVRAGMIELQTQIAGGEKPRNLVKAFSGFIKSASTTPPTHHSNGRVTSSAFEAALQASMNGGGSA